MEINNYDRVRREILECSEDNEYKNICKFLNELLRDRNSGLMDAENAEIFNQRIEKLKVRKSDAEDLLSKKLKSILEAYFDKVEGDEMVQIDHMNEGLYNRLRTLDVPNIYIKRQGHTKEITFSNYNPDIPDNDYEELEALEGDQPNERPRRTVKDLIKQIDDMLDNTKTFSDPIAHVDVLGYDAKADSLHFKIIEPEFQGNLKLDKFRVRLYEYKNDDLVLFEEEVEKPFLQLKGLDPGKSYYFTVEPGNELGYPPECKKFFVRAVANLPLCRQVMLYTKNEFMQVPENPNFTVEVKDSNIFSLKTNQSYGISESITDFSSTSSSLCLLNSGEMLECGMIARFKEELYNEKNLPLENESDAVIGVTDFYSPLSTIPVVSVSCGLRFCLALTCLGSVYSWGDNTNGQLGQEDYLSRILPTQIKKIPFIKKITASYQNVIAVDIEEKVYVWGKLQGLFGMVSTDNGPLIVPGNNDQNVPRRFDENLGAIKEVACGDSFNVILNTKGALYVCGDNKHGQLGFDYPNGLELPFCDTPHKLIPGGVQEFQVGRAHLIIKKLDESGKVSFLGCGNNKHQQISSNAQLLNVREPKQFELVDKHIADFWALESTSVFEYEDGEKAVLGNAHPMAKFLTKGYKLKVAHKEALTLLQY